MVTGADGDVGEGIGLGFQACLRPKEHGDCRAAGMPAEDVEQAGELFPYLRVVGQANADPLD